jgi:serine/threonine protein kinase
VAPIARAARVATVRQPARNPLRDLGSRVAARSAMEPPRRPSDDLAATLPASVESEELLSRADKPAPTPRAGERPPARRAPISARGAMPSVTGAVLAGKYRVERFLGSGHLAMVAAAYDLQLQRRVAIKYLLAESLEHPEMVERFAREARAAARVRGEHVARVLDHGSLEGGAPYIVFEFLEGVDLEAYLKAEGPLPITRAVRYALEICEGLAEVHAAQIIHRDMKPSNVFLAKGPDRQNTIKVLDFGVSKMIDEPMTAVSRMLGTVMYMSPEQLREANSVDLRTDIWSLGVILYELISGVQPFEGPTIVMVAQAIQRNTPRPLSDLRPDVPAGLEAVIAKCMKTDRADRYASVLDLAFALAPFARSRDRESVARITGVLHGSLAPPEADSGETPSASSGVPMILAPPPAILPGAPYGSEAPVVTAMKTAAHPVPLSLRRRALEIAILAGVLVLAVLIGRYSAAPSAITLRVTSPTPGAVVRIDGGPHYPLPLAQSPRRDGRPHTIEVEAYGFAPQTSTVTFESDVVVITTLAPKSPN